MKFSRRTLPGVQRAGDLAGGDLPRRIGWAIGRRYIQRPYRIRIKTSPKTRRSS
jgi:hypothetical protein